MINKVFIEHIGKNVEKCVFSMATGKCLGFMVSQGRIEVNPQKIKVILDMYPPSIVKFVQRLLGKIISLNRFMSRVVNRCLPFFRLLRKIKNFQWTKEFQKVFDELKKYLSSPPLLV